ncbi:MAG: hypothetical protein RL069_1749 [Planctomycetota bacterium]
MREGSSQEKNGRLVGWLGLLLGFAAILWVWLVVLPGLGRWEVVREHVDLLDRSNINAGAMFYTEVENHR